MGNVEPDPSPVQTSLTYLIFGEGTGDSDRLEEKTVLFQSAKGVCPEDATSQPPIDKPDSTVHASVGC